ncbi:hypothetical protein PFISCL1PPCAC_15840, partial [Pristionchus fissidentatus]
IPKTSPIQNEFSDAVHSHVDNRRALHRTLPEGTVRGLAQSKIECILLVRDGKENCNFHSQAVFDFFFVPYFIFNSNSMTWPSLYPFLLWTNGIRTFYPPFAYIYVFYLLYGQCYGVFLISLHRFLSIMRPHSNVIQFFDTLPRLIIFAAHVMSPLAGTSVHFFFQTPTRFVYRNATNTLQRYTETVDVSVNSAIATVTTTAVTFFGVFFYSLMFVRLRGMRSHESSRIKRRELPLIASSFFLFLFMCLLTAYFILLYLFSSVGMLSSVFELRSFYPLIECLFCYSTPWLLMLTSSETRKRVLGSRLDSLLGSTLWNRFPASPGVAHTQQTIATIDQR